MNYELRCWCAERQVGMLSPFSHAVFIGTKTKVRVQVRVVLLVVKAATMQYGIILFT